MILRKLAFCLLVSLVATAASAQPVEVFFAGGQSNAKPEWWATSIEQTLQNSSELNNPIVLKQKHNGDPIRLWYTDTPQVNYQSDFFNGSGTGLLQQSLQAIGTPGVDYVFKGLFWFQGESDANPEAAAAYESRFTGMLEQLRIDLGQEEPINFTMAIIDGEPDYYPEAIREGIRQGIEDIRPVQFALGSSANGSFVDSRGLTRVDAWHLDEASSNLIGQQMADVYIETFVPEPTSIVLLTAIGGVISCRRRKR